MKLVWVVFTDSEGEMSFRKGSEVQAARIANETDCMVKVLDDQTAKALDELMMKDGDIVLRDDDPLPEHLG